MVTPLPGVMGYEREGKEMKKRKKSATTESARKKRKNIAGGDASPSTQTHSDEVSKISNLLIKVKLIKKTLYVWFF